MEAEVVEGAFTFFNILVTIIVLIGCAALLFYLAYYYGYLPKNKTKSTPKTKRITTTDNNTASCSFS